MSCLGPEFAGRSAVQAHANDALPFPVVLAMVKKAEGKPLVHWEWTPLYGGMPCPPDGAVIAPQARTAA
jgi:hypothetical protein